MKIRPVVILFLAIAGSIFLFGNIVNSAEGGVLINEIKIGGSDGSTDEFIELFNTSTQAIDVGGWKIYKYTKSGNQYLIGGLPFNTIMFPYTYFLITHASSSIAGEADYVYYGTGNYSLADHNAVELLDSVSTTVDLVGYGEAGRFEGSAAAKSPGNKSIERNNFVDSDNNYSDFILIDTPTPHNKTYVYTPPTNQLPIAIINGPTSTAVGETEEFDGSDSNDSDGTIMSYQWSVDGEVIGDSAILSYQFATSGSFIVSLQVTDDQGASASTSLNIVVSEAVATLSAAYSILFINEFLSDPATSSEHEWIEIYNPTTSTVDLTGWTLSDSTGVRSSPTGTIVAGSFFVVELSNILNNTGDTIILKNPDNGISDSVIYGTSNLKAPDKGNSIARSTDGGGSWQETTTITKGLANIIAAPVVETHQPSGGSGSPAPQVNLLSTNLNSTGRIIINELLPNPKGSDMDNEFIELKNVGTEQVNLQDWIISDASSKYKIKEGIIYQGGFIVFKRSVTNIALNNSGEETVKLFNPAGSLIDSVKYTGPVGENESYVKKLDNTWAWTIKLTVGAENIFVDKNLSPVLAVEYMKEAEVGETAVFDASDTYDPESDSLQFIWTTGEEEKSGSVVNFIFERAGERAVELTVDDGHGNRETKKLKIIIIRNEEVEEIGTDVKTKNAVKTVAVLKKSSSKSYKPLLATTLEKIRDLEIGDRVKISGVVAVLPGIFGSQYFYIVSPLDGVQVYSNKKDFPVLKIGDKVEVTGELSQAFGEWRVKTKEKTNIKVIGFDVAPQALAVNVDDIDEAMVGSLVAVSGEITELKTSNLYLDDGTNEIKVYFKKGAGLNKKNYKLGETVKVIGIVGVSSSGLQLLPRSEFDVEKKADVIIFADDGNNKKSAGIAETYLTVTAGGLTSILIGLFGRARGKMALTLLRKTASLAVGMVKRGPKV